MGDTVPNPCIKRQSDSEEVILNIMTDIQKAIDQLNHMNGPDDVQAGVDVDGDNWRKTLQDAADGHVPVLPTATSVINDGLGNDDIYRLADEAAPRGHETLTGIPEEDEGGDCYRKHVPARTAASKAGVRPDARQSSISQSERHPNRILTPTIHGANQLYAWPFVPYNGQMVNSQSATSLVPCPVGPSSSHTNVYSFGHAAFSTASLPPLGTRSPTLSSHGGHQYVHPACWTVQETVHWLRSKGFEEAVCQRFVEQEIAGDALLNLDVSKLKTEVGIAAYGKRVRIDNAIAECRRLARQMSSLAIQPMRHGSSSPVDLPAQQSTARARAPLPSASAGNLLGSMSPPDPGNLRKVSSMPGPNRSKNRSKDKPRGRVEGQSITDKPDATVGLRLWVSSLLSSDGGHGETAKGSSPRSSLFRSDGVIATDAKEAVVQQEEKGNGVKRGDDSTKNLETQHVEDLIGSRSSSPSGVKVSSPRSIDQKMPIPQVTPRINRSQSMRERRSVNSITMYENSRPSRSGSALGGRLGAVHKLYRRYFGGDIETLSSPSSLSASQLSHDNDLRKSRDLDFDTSYRKEDQSGQRESNDSANSEKDHILVPNPKLASADPYYRPSSVAGESPVFQGILSRIGTPSHEGWMHKKGGHYNTWKYRYVVLKGPQLYWLRSDSIFETKVEGHLNTVDYRIVPDENINPGKYGFRMVHESGAVHLFSTHDKTVIRGWITALLKLKIENSEQKLIASPTNIPVIPLVVAQSMNPPPRPPSPTAQLAAQRTLKRANSDHIRAYPRTGAAFQSLQVEGSASQSTSSPVLPARDVRMKSPEPEAFSLRPPPIVPVILPRNQHPSVEPDLIEWANGHLPGMQITSQGSICGKFELLLIARSIKNTRCFAVPDHDVLSREYDDESLEGLFGLVDMLLDKEVTSGAAHTDDNVPCGNPSRVKVIQLLKALRAWEQRRTIYQSTEKSPLQGGPSVTR